MHARLPKHLILKEHSFTSQSAMLHKQWDSLTLQQCTAQQKVVIRWDSCHLSLIKNTERHAVHYPLLPAGFLISSQCSDHITEEAVERFRLKSDFISTALTDCYRFTSRYTANGEAQPLWLLW